MFDKTLLHVESTEPSGSEIHWIMRQGKKRDTTDWGKLLMYEVHLGFYLQGLPQFLHKHGVTCANFLLTFGPS